ncbi:MAG: tRNA uridine-5-carboxymethylaminomethyl(34) synthesis enzyme MnmG [Alphaproteobacteria bacterium]
MLRREKHRFDVVVVGGGHAGIEAALAATRLGAEVGLVTRKREDLGVMSCNPAFGGLGKGHLVREIDALDGLMARAGDASAIQFRLLNRSRGAAVRGPRVQADRGYFARAVREAVRYNSRLHLIEGEVLSVLQDADGGACGVGLMDGRCLRSGGVVLATGTFLGARIHIGDESVAAGRMGDGASEALCRWFTSLAGMTLLRLKTGTPPRLAADSIDYGVLEEQRGDERVSFLSFLSTEVQVEQRSCWLTRTTSETHAFVRAHLHESAIYSGGMEGIGPRYCPSFEDKLARFAERESHTVFLEPEGSCGEAGALIYPNGISNALPEDVQRAFVRTIPGLGRAEIVRPGYAVAYDVADPRHLGPDLQSDIVGRLFLAGQINGTTGYEEAGAQGLVAGCAAAVVAGMGGADSRASDFILSRSDSYIGVMIDDLITRELREPYRMLTARAEHRLRLRADNADLRLTPWGEARGLISSSRSREFGVRVRALEAGRVLLESCGGENSKLSAIELLATGHVGWSDLCRRWPCLGEIGLREAECLEAEGRYAPYIARQGCEVERLRLAAGRMVPRGLDYGEISGLGHEARSVLELARPRSFAEVERLVSPAAAVLLLHHLRRPRRHLQRGVVAGGS